MADVSFSRSSTTRGNSTAPSKTASPTLGLRVGDWVKIRPAEEILATLDPQGCLDALPFMPEMLRYCGRRFQVFKTAHKTCEAITYRSRRMSNAVHLAGLRCDGSGHDGCQANCLMFWKEAWLKRVDGPRPAEADVTRRGTACGDAETPSMRQVRQALERTARLAGENGEEPRYRCQATETARATTPLPWWEPRQYAQDLSYGNLKWSDFGRALAIQLLRGAQKLVGGNPDPSLRGLARDKPPAGTLDLQPGELVQVRPKEEIMATLNARLMNRGLSFDGDMARLCGRTFRVLRRVERIIDERTGKMLKMRHDCIMLEGAVCSGLASARRLGCPKSVYPFWREIWLRRVPEKARR